MRRSIFADAPIEWSDLEFIYSAEAEDQLEFVLQPPLRNNDDLGVDRKINALFDVETSLTANDGLMRGSVFQQRPTRRTSAQGRCCVPV